MRFALLLLLLLLLAAPRGGRAQDGSDDTIGSDGGDGGGKPEPTATTPLGTLAPSSDIVQCAEVDYKIEYIKYGRGLTTQDVYNHVSAPQTTPFIDPARTIFACIDGRDESYVVSTPGGDAAEFIVALTIFERYGGEIVTPETGANYTAAVAWWLADFLATHDDFRPQMYMHTDEHSAQRLLHFFGLDLGEVNLFDPPDQWIAPLLAQVTNASHIGCGHLRLMNLHPDIYGVPAPLPKAFVRAFHEYMWLHDASRVTLDVLKYDHTETAVLEVHSTVTRCGSGVYAPMIQPKINGSLFFIDHPDAVHQRRRTFADYFAPRIGMPADQFEVEMTLLAVQQLQLTVAVLASTQPIIKVIFVDLLEEELLALDLSIVLVIVGIVAVVVQFPVFSWQFLLWTGVCVRTTGQDIAHIVEERIHLLEGDLAGYLGYGDEPAAPAAAAPVPMADMSSHLALSRAATADASGPGRSADNLV